MGTFKCLKNVEVNVYATKLYGNEIIQFWSTLDKRRILKSPLD